jgi:tetratricopeptide (TPR) repeat protein
VTVGALTVGGVSVREPGGRPRLLPALEASARHDDWRAVRLLSRGLEEDPDSYAALVARGHAYRRLGEFALAAHDFERANGLIDVGRTHAAHGYCLNQLKQHEAAIAEYRLAIEAGFTTKEVFNNLGFSHHRFPRRDDPDEMKARSALDKAIDRDASFQAARHNRARLDLQRALKRPSYVPNAGVQDIEQALRLGPAPDLLRDAACLYAQAALKEPHPDQKARLIGQAFDCLDQAANLGPAPPGRAIDPALNPLRHEGPDGNRLEAILRRPGPSHPTPDSPLFVDPCPDSTD